MSAIRILDYQLTHQPVFRALNEEWITQFFVMEAPDYQMLDEPERYILEPGGAILMAEHQGQLVGTCALLPEGHGLFELAKMAVSPMVQGLGIGYGVRAGSHRQSPAARCPATGVAIEFPIGAGPGAVQQARISACANPCQRADVKMVLDL